MGEGAWMSPADRKTKRAELLRAGWVRLAANCWHPPGNPDHLYSFAAAWRTQQNLEAWIVIDDRRDGDGELLSVAAVLSPGVTE